MIRTLCEKMKAIAFLVFENFSVENFGFLGLVGPRWAGWGGAATFSLFFALIIHLLFGCGRKKHFQCSFGVLIFHLSPTLMMWKV